MVGPMSVGKAVETATKVAPIYKEEFRPAASELGKALTVVGKAINVALSPIAGSVWCYEQIADFLRPRLEQKLRNVPAEKIATPASNVAGPAIEAMRFTFDVPDLREMYANVLAAAMNVDIAHRAHPAFVEIIKQLNPDEARILRVLSDRRYRPIINVFVKEKGKEGKSLVSRYQALIDEEAGIVRPDLFPSYVDNLSRLGLIEVPEDAELTKPGVYDPILACAPVATLLADINASEGKEAEVGKSLLRLTSLGEQFVGVCTTATDPMVSG